MLYQGSSLSRVDYLSLMATTVISIWISLPKLSRIGSSWQVYFPTPPLYPPFTASRRRVLLFVGSILHPGDGHATIRTQGLTHHKTSILAPFFYGVGERSSTLEENDSALKVRFQTLEPTTGFPPSTSSLIRLQDLHASHVDRSRILSKLIILVSPFPRGAGLRYRCQNPPVTRTWVFGMLSRSRKEEETWSTIRSAG